MTLSTLFFHIIASACFFVIGAIYGQWDTHRLYEKRPERGNEGGRF